ncbi:helix-turn-helix domain-containing protein [Nitrospira sp. BLG_2]|uniref:helix-turn-helix domain-containing protein n=1 Tax=Nitrospira sp. BLG_2 TaxID=3397507 RepID=UPI003B9BF149
MSIRGRSVWPTYAPRHFLRSCENFRMTQRELERLTGISQSTISAIENNSVNLSVERAKVLARAIRCHPAVPVLAGCVIQNPRRIAERFI